MKNTLIKPKTNKQIQKGFKEIINKHAFMLHEYVRANKPEDSTDNEREWQDIWDECYTLIKGRKIIKNIKAKTILGKYFVLHYNRKGIYDKKNDDFNDTMITWNEKKG